MVSVGLISNVRPIARSARRLGHAIYPEHIRCDINPEQFYAEQNNDAFLRDTNLSGHAANDYQDIV